MVAVYEVIFSCINSRFRAGRHFFCEDCFFKHIKAENKKGFVLGVVSVNRLMDQKIDCETCVERDALMNHGVLDLQEKAIFFISCARLALKALKSRQSKDWALNNEALDFSESEYESFHEKLDSLEAIDGFLGELVSDLECLEF